MPRGKPPEIAFQDHIAAFVIREHGYGVLVRIQQISGGSLTIEQGALYPALFRLEAKGLLDTEWGTSENNRRAKYYTLTTAGRKRLKSETEGWNRLAKAMSTVLTAEPDATR